MLAVDGVLSSIFFFLPNVMMGTHLPQRTESAIALYSSVDWINQFAHFLHGMDVQSLELWLAVNLTLLVLLFALRRHVFYPMYGMANHWRGMLDTMQQEVPLQPNALFSMRAMAQNMMAMAEVAKEYYLKHRDANEALVVARDVLGQITAQQSAILNCTSREMVSQYQAVLSYANYLEECVARHAASPDLRYDFDEVSESSFNLKLIAGALNLIRQGHEPQSVKLDVPELMQQTLLALAPSLDRRAMKLTTVEVDLAVCAQSDPAIIAHVLWMMLLGTIRYAADESTLRLRCLYNRENTRCLISIVVSELSAGRLTEEERGAFLERQLQHLTPHMFAETIRIHANMQLAEMLMKPLDGTLSILPLTSHSCEICLNLPAAMIA